MSCNYADGLSPYHDKGQLGLEERFDTSSVIAVKIDMLAKWINKANHVVIHTGAGISTSAGIPDFRGPKGVWTLEAKGRKPENSTDFNEAIPTTTHMALTRLVESGKVKYVVSQNIDGLHLRSGLSRQYLSELHGNMFVEECSICHRQFVRKTPVPTVGQKNLNIPCPTVKPNGRICRGRMHDTILDWEHNLPENDLAMADFNSCLADLSIALGTTMQIIPSGSLPLYTKKTGGKLVIINLQPTKHDTKADLLIRGYVDDVMVLLLKQLSLRIPKYSVKNDPTQRSWGPGEQLEWTITNETTAKMRLIYETKCGSKEAKKRLEVIDEDDVPIAERIKEKTIRKRKEEPRASKFQLNDSDSDLEVVAEIKKKRGRPRKNPLPTPPPPAPTKLILKKNVTPNKPKYEIVQNRPPKRPKVEIVKYSDEAPCDLEMVCESDNEDPVPFTTNFRLYLENDTIFKTEKKMDPEIIAATGLKKTEDCDIKPDNANGQATEIEQKNEATIEEKKEKTEATIEEKKETTEATIEEKEKKTEATIEETKEIKQEEKMEIVDVSADDKLEKQIETTVVEPAETGTADIQSKKGNSDPVEIECFDVEENLDIQICSSEINPVQDSELESSLNGSEKASSIKADELIPDTNGNIEVTENSQLDACNDLQPEPNAEEQPFQSVPLGESVTICKDENQGIVQQASANLSQNEGENLELPLIELNLLH